MTVSHSARKFRTVCFATALAIAGLGLATPAQAHTCESYHGCDEDGCREGENHDHTNQNSVGRDERCQSTADGSPPPPPPPPECRVLGQRAPKVVCEGPTTAIAFAPPAALADW